MLYSAIRPQPRVFPALALTLVLLAPALADGAPAREVSATEVVQRHFEAVLALLKSPAFRDLPVERRHAALRLASDRIFGWDEMARRSLGASWGARGAGERRAFTECFVRVVERFYLGRLEEVDVSEVSRVPIRYLGEAAAARETIVQTRLVHRRDLPVNFRMVHRGNRWQVVDVEVDGVSVVDNYRAQFARVMTRNGYPALVERLEHRANGPGEARGASASP